MYGRLGFYILEVYTSIEALNWAWQQTGLKPTEKLTLLAISDHADELGRNAFPSRSRLAKKTGLAEATVTRAIKSLGAKGRIFVDHIKSKAGDFDHNEYTLPLGDNVTVSRGVGSQRDNRGWAQGVTGVGSQCAPNHPNNHPKEKDPPNPQVKQFIQWWCERYKEVVKDDYMVRWALEGSVVKKLLESKSLEEVKRRAERLLTTTDHWLRQHRTIPMLSSKWNELGQQGPFESEQEGPSMRVL